VAGRVTFYIVACSGTNNGASIRTQVYHYYRNYFLSWNFWIIIRRYRFRRISWPGSGCVCVGGGNDRAAADEKNATHKKIESSFPRMSAVRLNAWTVSSRCCRRKTHGVFGNETRTNGVKLFGKFLANRRLGDATGYIGTGRTTARKFRKIVRRRPNGRGANKFGRFDDGPRWGHNVVFQDCSPLPPPPPPRTFV